MSLVAVSPDGRWRFDGGRLHSATASEEPFAIDFFDRWTYARFLAVGVLALGFESGQPWSEYGSYGDRYGGVQVLRLAAGQPTWSLVSIEYDFRSHDEEFVPDDVVWHARGVLGWLADGMLYAQVLRQPRGPVVADPVPTRDSDLGLDFYIDQPGRWRTLSLDATGTT